jgi:DNA-binding FrmR family transcriptional regulator
MKFLFSRQVEPLTKSIRMIYFKHPTPLGGVAMGSQENLIMKHENALKRLKTVEGHIRGIERMVENDTYCIDVIHQIQAVQSALNKISAMILDEHLNSCLITAVRGEDPDERERVLKEITDVFETASRT